MGTLPHIEYVGFTTRGSAREYTLRVRRPSGDAFFVLSIPTEAFDARRVRYQDAAEICFWKMQRALEAWDQAPGAEPLATQQTISEADLLEYRDAHAAKPRRFSPPSPPRPA